jgi:hypothetical protein
LRNLKKRSPILGTLQDMQRQAVETDLFFLNKGPARDLKRNSFTWDFERWIKEGSEKEHLCPQSFA